MRYLKNGFWVTLLCIFSSYHAFSQATVTLDSTVLTEREVAIGLQIPWEILWGPDDHIWVTERRGRVLRIEPESGNTTTVLNIENLVSSGSEPGMLGMALHSDFGNTPLVYIVYNYGSGFNRKEKLVSYEWNGSTLENETILLGDIEAGGIHNGSRLLIAPDDKIMMTMGDIGSAGNSQNMNNVNGKTLRINLDGSVPEDNPIPGSHIYSYGHRNQQGLAYGPNGQLYASEHGQSNSDEFNLVEPNRNYGWPNVEGACNTSSEINFCNANNVREPLIEFSPCAAVNGIHFYDHEAIPEWKGKMLMAVLGGFALNDARLSVLAFNEDGTEVIGEDRYFEDYGRIRDVCVNPYNGAVYFANNGPFYPGSGPNRIIEYRNLDYVTVNTDDELNMTQFVSVYPNPVSKDQDLTLEISASFIGETMELIQFNGQRVRQQKVLSNNTVIKTNDLPAGNYYIRIESDLGVVTKKVVVQ